MKKKKIVKLIDILCLMSLNEKIPEKIKYDNQVYNYCDVTKDYYYTIYGINIYLFKTLFSRPTTFLNDEVEILETMDEFDEIEEITIRDKTIGFPNGEWTARNMDKAFAIKINQLIKSQKKIMKKLREEGK